MLRVAGSLMGDSTSKANGCPPVVEQDALLCLLDIDMLVVSACWGDAAQLLLLLEERKGVGGKEA